MEYSLNAEASETTDANEATDTTEENEATEVYETNEATEYGSFWGEWLFLLGEGLCILGLYEEAGYFC